MSGINQKGLLNDVELLIQMLKIEWSCSKEPVWRLEVPKCIFKACNKELDEMTDYIHCLKEKSKEEKEGEKLSLFRMVYATKKAHVLIRVAKKILEASKENSDRELLVINLDDEEYKMVTNRFSEYL